MKTINLVNGGVTKVDDVDFRYLCKWKWRSGNGYAVRSQKLGHKHYTTILMHRAIMEPDSGLHIDHIDGNGLNNQRSNLRIATVRQNAFNRKKPCTGRLSNYKGVSHRVDSKGRKRWRAYIRGADKRMAYLGTFSNEKDAAMAYNRKAIELRGDFARINKI